mmetsp:Transcript_19052/g.28256  ORF Transcript_19052/g.28256 Transcript_19052/m.28256 type:complete len:389 (+) Transcript_19052:171-1337(+)
MFSQPSLFHLQPLCKQNTTTKMKFLSHLIPLVISLCNVDVVVASKNDDIDMKIKSKMIDMKPKSKMIHKMDHLAISAVGLIKEDRARSTKKRLEDFVKDDKVQEHVLSRHLKKKEGKSEKKSQHRLRPHSEPTKAKAKSSKAGTCDEELAQTQAALELSNAVNEWWEWFMNQPSLLFVQMADKCIIDNSTGTPLLKALKEDFFNITEAFADRPLRQAHTNSTEDFFSKFNEMFEEGGVDGDQWPNAAVTLVDSDKSYGIAISGFVGSYVDESGTYYGYELKQYPEQAAMLSLEDLLEGNESVTFDHCSIFIDSFWAVVAGIACGIGGFVGGAAVGGVAGGAAGGAVGLVGGPGGAAAGAVVGGFVGTVGGAGTGAYLAGKACAEDVDG